MRYLLSLFGSRLFWVVVACLFAFGKVSLATEIYVNPSVSTVGTVGNVATSVSYLSQGATVSAIQFDLQYDRSALTVTATAGSSTINANKALAMNVLPNGDTRFVIYGLNQTAIGDGPIVNLAIQVNANPSTSSYPLVILNQVASAPDGTAVALATQSGSIDIVGTWQPLKNQPLSTLGAAFLLTDGTVMVQDNGPNNNGSGNWWKLTPDQTGNYINGSWSQLASLPASYAPLDYASAVLSDGRLVVVGGTINSGGSVVQTNQGAIYDPTTDSWTSLAAPNAWAQIGAAPSVVLPDGRFLVGHISDSQLALLDPVTLAWSVATSPGKSDSSAGEGFNLLPDGTVLTVNTTAFPGAQRYDSSTGQWISAGSTPTSLVANGVVGPATLRPDGTVFATGANGHNAVYSPPASQPNPGTWAAAPDFPTISGEGQLDVAQGPACVLPNGKVLVAASPGVNATPVHFFEFDGTNLTEVPRPPNALNDASSYGHLLLLPNGQVAYFDARGTGQVYTPSGGPNPAWAPTVASGPTTINPGATYSISGTQFNGLSQAVVFGASYQAATNYPSVRISNNTTGDVFYSKTHGHSTMAVATGSAVVSTNFDVPINIELGPSQLVVVANGIPSAPLSVNVASLVSTSTVTSLKSSLNPATAGQSLTFTATVSTTTGATPTGTVVIYDGTTPLGTSPLNAGTAIFVTSALSLGSHSITAAYTGGSSFTSSTSSPALTQVVNGKPSTITLASSQNFLIEGQSVAFTATVSSSAGGTPTGFVTFYSGSTALGTGTMSTLNGSQAATFSTTTLALGSSSISASYSGDATYSSSTSSALNETVSIAGFAPAPTGLVVTAGQNLPISLILYAAQGSGLSFTLTCSGVPAKSGCEFGSNPVAPGPPPTGTTVQLTFQTSSSELLPIPSDRSPQPRGTPWIIVGLGALLAILLQLCRVRSRRPAFGMCVTVLVLGLILCSCGGGSGTTSPPSNTGTPTGTYTFMVNGVSGTGSTSTTISTQVTVMVQ